jgi:hypothetical protein
MFKKYVSILIILFSGLGFSQNSQAAVILDSGDSFSSSFNLVSDGDVFKETDLFWDVLTTTQLIDSFQGNLTITMFENSDFTGFLQTYEDRISTFPRTVIAGGDEAYFTDLNGSFTIQNTGSSQIILNEITIASFAGNIPPSGVAFDTITPSPVPLPAAAWLMISGLSVFGFLRKKTSNTG